MDEEMRWWVDEGVKRWGEGGGRGMCERIRK